MQQKHQDTRIIRKEISDLFHEIIDQSIFQNKWCKKKPKQVMSNFEINCSYTRVENV